MDISIYTNIKAHTNKIWKTTVNLLMDLEVAHGMRHTLLVNSVLNYCKWSETEEKSKE